MKGGEWCDRKQNPSNVGNNSQGTGAYVYLVREYFG